MKRPNQFQTPGRHPTDPTRQHWNVVLENGQYVESNHYTNFLQKVFKALEANHLYTGEGWSDQVLNMVCEQNPHIPCVDTERVPMVTGWNDVRRFFITLGDMIGSGRPLVSEQVQEQRIQTCVGCVKNVSLGACSGCSWVANKLSELSGGRRIKGDERVHRRGCASCGCEISVKTAYPIEVLRLVDDRLDLKEPYAEQCWMLHE